ncbi:MAG: hypothetical protein ACFFCQ_14680, partial [Promethearchaeota archaeon]
QLFNELKAFPENIDGRFYTSKLQQETTIFQGDGIKDLLVINLPDPRIGCAPGMVFSNTCDIDLDNTHLFAAKICYAPILNLRKYRQMLLRRKLKSPEAIDTHIQHIRQQRAMDFPDRSTRRESPRILDKVDIPQYTKYFQFS